MGPVTDTHRVTYEENFKLALQEGKPQFDDTFEYTSQVKGKQVQVTDIIGTSEARIDAPEGGPTPNMASQHEPVWMRPRRVDWGKLLSVEDYIKSTNNFRSSYIMTGTKAMTRARNSILASAVFGPRLIGNEVPTSSPWNGDTVAVDVGADAATGMNVKKILRALRLLEEAEITPEEEQLYLGLDPEEVEGLYYDLTYVSKDYRDRAQLEDMTRRVTAIFGIPIVPTKRFSPVDPDGTTSVAALWCKSGMYWGEAMALDLKSAPAVGQQFREQVYAEQWFAATRTEDKKVIKILNKKA